jgi:hypothetical protein
VLSFFSSLADVWDPHVGVSLPSSFSHFPLSPCTASRRPARAVAMRTDGMVGPPSWHACPVQEFHEGRISLLPSPGDAKGARAATGGWPRRRHGVSSNWGAPATTFPLRRLDRDPKSDPETPAAPHQPAWGFTPFLRAPPREKGRVEAGEGRSRAPRRRRRAAAGGRP